MRKITLLFAAALSMIAWTGVMADVTQPTLTTDPSNPALYTIKSLRTGKYATYTGANSQLSQDANLSKASLWFFEENGEGVSIIPAKDPSVKLVTNSSANETGAVWYLVENPYKAGYFCVTLSNNASSNCWDDQGNQTKIGYWQPSATDNEGTSWIIEPFDMENPIEVTYELYVDGTKSSSATVLQEANSAVNIPQSLIDGLTYKGFFHKKFYYDYTPEGTIGDTDCTITITRTENAGLVKALSDLSNTKAYNIGCDRGAMIAYDGKMVNTALQDATVNAQPYGKFALLNYEDNYYIFSIDENKFVKNDASVALDLTTVGFSTEDAIVMEAQTAPYFLWHFNAANKYLNTNGNTPLGYVINNYSTPDQGNQYYMVAVDDFDPTAALAELEAYFHPSYFVTYVVKDEFGNVIFTSEKQPAKAGATITTLLDEFKRPYYTYSEENVTITEQETTVEFTATWNGPFKLSESFDNAQWQNMAVRNEWYVTSNNKNDEGALKTIEANAIGLIEDAYQWAFVGNDYDGFQIFNKAEGADKVYVWKDNSNAVPEFIDATTENRWAIVKTTRTEEKYKNSFMLTIPGTTYRQLNQNGGAGGPLKLWTATTTSDEGSAFTVFDVPTNFAPFVNDEIAPYFESDAKYFVLTNAAKAEIGYDPAYKTDCPYEAYKSMKEKLTDEFVGNISNYVLPETGFYLLKNKYYGTYMGIDPSDANMYGNYAAANAAKHIVKLTKTGDATYTIGLMGKFAPATVGQSQPVTATAEAGTYTVVITTLGYAAFKANPEVNMSCLHCRAAGDIVGWEAPADASKWEAIDADGTGINLAVGDAGYATTYMPFPVAIPEGVKAYTATIAEKDNYQYLELAEVTTTIPELTPVILKAEPATYTFKVGEGVPDGALGIYDEEIEGNKALVKSYTGPLNEGNILQGTLAPTDAAGKYVLAKVDPETEGFGYPVAFCKAESGTLAAGKAYIAANTASEIKAFYFGFAGDATGIATVEKVQTENGIIFNLAGQRINKMQKGINIVNGKKILK